MDLQSIQWIWFVHYPSKVYHILADKVQTLRIITTATLLLTLSLSLSLALSLSLSLSLSDLLTKKNYH